MSFSREKKNCDPFQINLFQWFCTSSAFSAVLDWDLRSLGCPAVQVALWAPEVSHFICKMGALYVLHRALVSVCRRLFENVMFHAAQHLISRCRRKNSQWSVGYTPGAGEQKPRVRGCRALIHNNGQMPVRCSSVNDISSVFSTTCNSGQIYT